MPIIAGQITGSILSGSLSYTFLSNIPLGIVSGAAQVQPLLPGGTVSSSAQYPGWVTASSQVDITTTTGYSTFSSSIATKNDLQDISINALNAATSSYAINSTIQSQLAGVVSSSTQVKPLLPGGTVTSSAQYPGWVSSSAQIDYNSIQNKLSGVVSSSTQVKPLLPGGTVTSSAQYPGWVTSSAQIDYNSITNKLSGVVSSAAQVAPLLPGGTVSSSAQYPGWVTSSTQIDYNNIQNKLSGVVSSAAQVAPLLPGGTVSSSGQQVVSTYTNGSDNRIITSTAANGINGEANLTFDGNIFVLNTNQLYVSASRIGINTAVPSASLHVSGTTIIQQIIERVNVTASAPPTTFNLDLNSGSIFFRSASTAANWTLNFRGDANTTLNNTMYNGQSVTATVLVFNGATAYSASAYQIDGASVTPRWQGGTSGSANANSLDAHQFTIVKISSASYHLLGSITKYT